MKKSKILNYAFGATSLLLFLTIVLISVGCSKYDQKEDWKKHNTSESIKNSSLELETFICRSLINDSQVVKLTIVRNNNTGEASVTRTIENREQGDEPTTFIDHMAFSEILTVDSNSVFLNIDESSDAWVIPFNDPDDPNVQPSIYKIYTPADFVCDCCEAIDPEINNGSCAKNWNSSDPMGTLKCKTYNNCTSCGLALNSQPSIHMVVVKASNVTYD